MLAMHRLTGTVGPPVNAGSPLLVGTATAFGFQDPPGGETCDFLFNVTGGSLAGAFGSSVYVRLSTGPYAVPFTGTFGSDFSNYGLGVSDTYPAFGVVPPEPATLALVGLGFGGLVLRRMRRKT
jgi:hypothetical protein